MIRIGRGGFTIPSHQKDENENISDLTHSFGSNRLQA